MVKTIGIIGYGHFGAFVYLLLSIFAPWIRVSVYSPEHRITGRKFRPFAEVCQSDAVVLAVPIRKYKEVLLKVLRFMRDDTIIVDVATVKVHTVELLKRHAAGKRWIAIHPMFGPESFKRKRGNVRGFKVVVCAHRGLASGMIEALIRYVERKKFLVVRMSAHTHDRHIANSLFRVHYFGQTARRDRFCRTPIDTVSFGFLMDAFESVWHDRRLFKDVYKYNPYCEEVRRRIKDAQRCVDAELRAA